MSENSLWQLFTDTGAPLSWLYYRAAVKNDNIVETAKSSEDKPQALG